MVGLFFHLTYMAYADKWKTSFLKTIKKGDNFVEKIRW